MIDTRAYSEIFFIINNMSYNMQKKIPKDLKKAIEVNLAPNYIVNKENIMKGKMLKDTEKILSVIYTDYLSTQIERKVILARERSLEYKKEVEKKKKFMEDRRYIKVYE